MCNVRKIPAVLALLAMGALTVSNAFADGGGGGNNVARSSVSAVAYVEAKPISRGAETAIGACGQQFDVVRRCVADILDAYADALRNTTPALPPDLKALPDIVSRAAQRVRVARTKAVAVNAIKIAIAEIRKTISLLRADDPFVLRAEARTGGFVAETLEVADNKLERAVGL